GHGVSPRPMERRGLERRKVLGDRQRDLPKRQVGRLGVSDAAGPGTLKHARGNPYTFGISIDGDQCVAVIGPAISSAKDRLVLSKPRKRPAEANGGSKVVTVIVHHLLTRVW